MGKYLSSNLQKCNQTQPRKSHLYLHPHPTKMASLEPNPPLQRRGLAVADLLNPSTPKRSRFTYLTRDQRVEIRALCKYAGLSYEQIFRITPYTFRQIQTACTQPVTPRKRGCKLRIRTPPTATVEGLDRGAPY